MPGPFYFAWVPSTQTVFDSSIHAVWEEDVVSMEIMHREGEFAGLSVIIKNPRQGLLASGRRQWAWLSYENGSPGPVPLFFGRLVAVPADLDEEAVKLEFIARPIDFEEQKEALAETLRVHPWWDPIWITEPERDNPDSILESRSEAWHIDRVTHLVTLSDMIEGEDGTIEIGEADIVAESLSMSYGQPPLRSVRIKAEVHWTQVGEGEVDCTIPLAEAFDAAGTDGEGRISSLTGDGLINDWPDENAEIGGGWTFGPFDITRLSGGSKTVECQYFDAPDDPDPIDAFFAQPIIIKFPIWNFHSNFVLRYKAERSRSETLTFTLSADCQRITFESGDLTRETIALSSSSLMEEIDPTGSTGTYLKPIRDLRRPNYFPTDRGRESLEYLICLAASRIKRRARTVEIISTIRFEAGIDISLRMNGHITDARLPGGEATGKITAYRLYGSGDGEFGCQITVGCTIGEGGSVSANHGGPSYGADGYMDTGYQLMEGQTWVPIDGVYYEDFFVPPNDDGIDFFDMVAEELIKNIEVINGETIQRNALDGQFADVAQAVAALNAVPTEVDLTMKPVEGGPFTTNYTVVVSGLKIPKTIELAAP